MAWVGGTLLVVAAALAAWQFAPQSRHVAPVLTRAGGPDLPLVPAGEGTDIRILAGSHTPKYVDRFGNVWSMP